MARLRQSAAPRHLAPDPAWLAATLRGLDELLAAGEYQRAEETARAVVLPERACGRRGAWADGCPACQAVDAVGIELAMREMAARIGVPVRHPSDSRRWAGTLPESPERPLEQPWRPGGAESR